MQKAIPFISDIEFITGKGTERFCTELTDKKVAQFFEITRDGETRRYAPVQYLQLVMEAYYNACDHAGSYGERIVCIINAESRIKRYIWMNRLDKFGYDFQHILDDLEMSRKRIEAYIKYEIPIRKRSEHTQEENTGNDYIKSTIDDYLEPLYNDKMAFSKNEYPHIVAALTGYFEHNKQRTGKPFFVSHGNKKRLGYALGCIYRGLKTESLSYEYLCFCRKLFACFTDEEVNEDTYLRSNLYKYLHSKTQ